MQNMGQFMKQAQQLQAKMAEVQKKAEVTLVEGHAGGGAVKAIAYGKGEIQKIEVLDATLWEQDNQNLLIDVIVAAVNNALKRAKEQMESEMSQLTGGMQMPKGLF